MKAVAITQITAPELESLIENSFKKIISSFAVSSSDAEADELLTIQQAAVFLKLSVPTLYRLVNCSAIPVNRKSKHLHFSKQELSGWIKSSRRKTKRKTQGQKGKPCGLKQNRMIENSPAKKSKSSCVTYKREKNNIEISGDANDVKRLIWTDMISAKLWDWIIKVLLFTLSKAGLLLLLLRWLK